MRQTTITVQKTVPLLEIRIDDSAESPRSWDNLGYLITKESRYSSPDNHPEYERIISETWDEASDVENHIELIKARIPEAIYIVPVSKYEHSGVSYTRGVSRWWDQWVVGFYIITEKSRDLMGTEPEYFDQCIDGELETYTAWANGNVYGFILRDESWNEIDSCWWLYSLEDIRDHIQWYNPDWRNEDLSEYIIYS